MIEQKGCATTKEGNRIEVLWYTDCSAGLWFDDHWIAVEGGSLSEEDFFLVIEIIKEVCDLEDKDWNWDGITNHVSTL